MTTSTWRCYSATIRLPSPGVPRAGRGVHCKLGTTLPTPLYLLWQEHDRLPVAIITVLFAIFTLRMLTALLRLSRISDHFGRRPVLLGALALACVSTALFVIAEQVMLLLAG